MRPRTLVALLSVFLTPGCLLDYDRSFATPEATVATFQTAFAHDDEFTEYDCFARAAKDAGLTQQAWSTARSQLFEPLGAPGRFVLRRNDLVDNLVARDVTAYPPLLESVVAAVNGGDRDVEAGAMALEYELFGHGLRLHLVPETTLLLPDPADGQQGKPPRAFRLDAQNAKLVALPEHGRRALVVTVALPAAIAQRCAAEGVAWVRIERHWKLIAPEVIEASDRPPLPPRSRTTRTRAIEYVDRVTGLHPTVDAAELGVAPTHFVLPLPVMNDAMSLQLGEIEWQVAPAAKRATTSR